MKKAIIFLNGDLSDVFYIKNYIDAESLIICTNGGTKYALKLRLDPHVIIGDFDSLSPTHKKILSRKKITWIAHPKNKDQTDFELALNFALKERLRQIIVTGILGRRLDHFITNLSVIAHQSKKIEIIVVEGNEEMYFVKDKLKLKTKKGRRISLIPIFKNCQGISTQGLYYELKNEILFLGSGRGVSNVAVSNIVSVSVKKGTILLIHHV